MTGATATKDSGLRPLDATTLKAVEVFVQLNPVRQDIVLGTMRVLLEVQRGNESEGLTVFDDAALYRRPW